MEVAEDKWASLLPDLLLDIFCRLETTAVVRCASACKPWRLTIISNASRLHPCPDRYNPNLLLGFFHHSWYQGVMDGSSRRPPPVTISVTTADTGHSEKLSTFIPPESVGGVDLSLSYSILMSRDGFLLLQRRSNLPYPDPDELCLCNPLSGDCAFLPSAPAAIMEECLYVLVTGYDLSHCFGSRTMRDGDLMPSVQVLAVAGDSELCTTDNRLTYQVFSGDVWGPVQRSEEVSKGLEMITYGCCTVVSRDAVYWLAGPAGTTIDITSTVGLDVCTGRAWTTELPKQCQCYDYCETPYVLTTSRDGRLSLLQPLRNHDIRVWVLVGDGQWTVQHRVSIGVQNQIRNYPGIDILDCNYYNVLCPRSGFLFIMLSNRQQLRTDLENRARPPVHCIGERVRYHYYPYEMDWSTYISKMKIF